ncbi:histone deacetylase 4-like [Diadema setosum]|uniref:histone deacetylase 4-like n=1 Tax=Diadema setosum TaxID=31175 RepID=UPI003B3A3D98
MSSHRQEAALGPNSEAVNIASQISNMHLKGDVASSQVQLGSQVPTDHVATDPRALPQEWMALQQQQQLQQHMLFAQFKERQTQLAQQHQKQQQELIMQLQREQLLEQQKRQMEVHQREQHQQQQQQQEQQHLEQFLAKKGKPSAVASTEVKDKLQRFLLNRQQKFNDVSGSGALNHSPPYRHWTPPSSMDHHSPPHNVSPQFHHQPMGFGQYDSSNFPLRKTASDSNLKVRSRLKEKVTERRTHGSPLLRRRDGPNALKRKPLSGELNLDTSSNSAPGSGPSSPLSGGAAGADSPNGVPVAALPEEASSAPKMLLKQRLFSGPASDLYTSPSLPNISIGIPAANNPQHSPPLGPVKPCLPTATMIGAAPLNAYLPTVPGASLSLAGINPALLPGMTFQDYQQAQTAAISAASVGIHPKPIRPITHRPLVRTHSAPLPNNQQAPTTQRPHSMLLSHHHSQLLQQHQLINNLAHQKLVEERREDRVQEEREAEESESEVGATAAAGVAGSPGRPSPSKAKEALKTSIQIKQEPIDITEEEEEEEAAETARGREDHLDVMRSSTMSKTGLIGGHRPLMRVRSSPAASSIPSLALNDHTLTKYKFTTGLAYDTLMLKHQCLCGNNQNHPEHPGRLQSIWARLHERGIVNRCERIRTRKATLDELQSCHSEGYSLFFGTSHTHKSKLDSRKLACIPKLNFTWLQCGGLGVDTDTVWHDIQSPGAVRMAAGAVIQLAFLVATGELKNGFAIVRPPGHHAEVAQAMGFCFFNSVAIAAKQLRLKLKLNKILIVDWDVHHGNSTQKIFYEDPHVLYISLHRHDNGNFFPGTGAPDECGCGAGLGSNVNIAFHGGLNPPMGDVEYIAAFRSVVLPIAQEFSPDVVLVSAGFDAANGHPNPLGGYKVTPACFAYMTRKLMGLANGRVVLALEGGYDLTAICDASEVCAQTLLGDDPAPLSEETIDAVPNANAVECLQRTIGIQSEYWSSVRNRGDAVGISLREALKREGESEVPVNEMASLSVQQQEGTSSNIIEESAMEAEEASPS